MSSGELIVVAVAIFGASVITVVAGFGFALLAMPLMTLAVPVERAVVIVTIMSLASTLWQAVTLRQHADRPLAGRLIAGSLVGMPLGLVVLSVVADRPLRLMLGVSVLVACVLLVRRVSLAHVGVGLDYSAGFASGVLNTSLSTNGPPLVLDLQARQLEPDRFRATIALVFAASNVVGLALFAGSGRIGADELGGAAVATPGWALGLALGAWVRPHVFGERFRRLVIGLLLAVGVSTIAVALVR